MRTAHGWGIITVAAVLTTSGCTGGGSTAGPVMGDAAIQSAAVVAQVPAFQQPRDAAPSPDGSQVYFVATANAAPSATAGPAVLRAPADGGPVSTIAQGAPLVKPTGVAVATDGSRVYVADSQAVHPGTPGGPGAILTAPTTGTNETPTVLPGTEGRAPRGLDVVNQGASDLIYFTGTDPANGLAGLFQVSTDGGTITTVAEGAPFISPDSVVVNAQGVAYVSDQGPNPNLGLVLSVTGGTVTPILNALDLGSPAGVTLVEHDAVLLVSAQDPLTASDQVLFFDLATGKTATATKVIGAHKASSGGLHRAYRAPVLGWADTRGSVYRIRFP
jgi:hypothetical protein